MLDNELNNIDMEISKLINDKNQYNFTSLKSKVVDILKKSDTFLIDNEINSKAIDLYLKNVITQRNNIKKQQEKTKIDESKETKYKLIEAICQKNEFESQDELIKKIEVLERKTNVELNEILKSS